MDLQTLLHNLHEEVSCSVCMSPFTEPKILPCFHTFCLHCLNDLQRTSGKHGEITCPECRRNYQVPGSGYPKDLPANFRMNSLLDVMAIQKCSVAGVKCGNCEKTSAQSFYCFKCCAFWCDDCIAAHNVIRANKEHKVLAIKDFQDQDIEDVLKRPVFCQKEHHESKKLKFFCKDCEVAICNTCVVTLHEGHVKVPLQDAANERKLRLESVLESQKGKALRKRSMITRLQKECNEIKEQVACVKKGAQNFADNLMRVIEAKKQEIFKEVEDKAQQSIERLVEQQSNVEKELQRIETLIEKTETFLKRSTNTEIVHSNTLFQEVVTDEAELVDCDRKDLGHFVFFANKSLTAKANSEGVGSLKQIISQTKPRNSTAEGKGIIDVTVGLEAQFVLTTRNAENEQCYEQCDIVTVEIRNHDGRECATEAQVQDNKDGSYNISYFAKEAGTCQTSVMVNGQHVSSSPFTVQVKPRQYKPVLSFGGKGSSAGMFDRPWGVAVNERNKIAVTDRDNGRVQIFSSDGTCLRSFGRRGNKEGEFIHPSGIAYLNNGNIVVADSGNHRLQIFTGRGNTQIGGKAKLDHQFDYPWGLSVDSDGNIVVADSNNKLIKIFSPSGQFLRKFGGKDLLVDPCHCIQKDQYFIVSDYGDHSIKVFNTDGKFLYKFGKKGRRDVELMRPRCLSFDKAGHLMVCDFENHRVKMLELNGKLIKKFQLKSGGLPISTAVLSDGRIVMSDFSGNRIQIIP